MLRYLKVVIILMSCMSFACHFATSESDVQIGFTRDSTAVLLLGLDQGGRLQAQDFLKRGQDTGALLSVVQLIDEDDSSGMEQIYPGKVEIHQDSLLFIPDQPFQRGKQYLVQTMLGSSFGTTADVLKAEMGSAPKAQARTLTR